MEKIYSKAYLLIERVEKKLSEGFLPIQLFIYDIMRFKMYNLYDEIKNMGINIMGINTDSLFIDKDIDYKMKQMENDKFENIGKVRFEKDKTFVIVTGKSHVIKNDLNIEYKKPTEKIINIDDEWDSNEITNIFKTNNKVFVKATIPGAGKTTALKKYADEIGVNNVLSIHRRKAENSR